MARKKNQNDRKDQNDKNDSVVTLIDDPFGIKTGEILEAQNISDELDLDENLDLDETLDQVLDKMKDELENESEINLENEDLDFDTSSESLEDQMAKLAQAIADQTKADADELVDTLKAELDVEHPSLNFQEKLLEFEQDLDPEQPNAPETERGAESHPVMDEILADVQDLIQLDGASHSHEEAPLNLSPSEENQLPLMPEISLDLAEIQSCIEAILFMSDKPISAEKLRTMLGAEFAVSLFEDALSALSDRYQSSHHGIELVEVGGGYQLRTKPGRSHLSQKLVKTVTQRLSSGCMETLAIIAYKQPAMKDDIDKIRGVDSSHFIRGLMDKKLIQISGRSELPGRPMLYNTTQEFLEIFGIKDLNSLPSLRELEQMVPHSQSNNPEDEDPRVRDMRRLVGEMKADKSSALYYNPKEDDRILKEIREQVSAIPISTPYLDQLKQEEQMATEALKAQEQLKIQEENLAEHDKVPAQVE